MLGLTQVSSGRFKVLNLDFLLPDENTFEIVIDYVLRGCGPLITIYLVLSI